MAIKPVYTQQIVVSVTPETKAALVSLSNDREVSLGRVAREFISHGLDALATAKELGFTETSD